MTITQPIPILSNEVLNPSKEHTGIRHTQTAREIYQKAISLKPQEQVELVDKLLDHLDSPDKAIDDLWKKESENRIDAYEQGNLKAVSLNEIVTKNRWSNRI